MAKPSGSDPDIGSSNLSSSTKYTTVVVDIYGRVYDLRKEHPSYEIAKKNKGKKGKGPVYERCIVANAFTWPVDGMDRLRKRKGKR